MINIDYNTLAITWVEWNEVPSITELMDEMDRNGIDWDYDNWNSYLQHHYNLNINIRFGVNNEWGLQFNNIEEMDLFIINFL